MADGEDRSYQLEIASTKSPTPSSGTFPNDIALADHADQLLTVDHRQPAHLVPGHGAHDLLERGIRSHG